MISFLSVFTKHSHLKSWYLLLPLKTQCSSHCGYQNVCAVLASDHIKSIDQLLTQNVQLEEKE